MSEPLSHMRIPAFSCSYIRWGVYWYWSVNEHLGFDRRIFADGLTFRLKTAQKRAEAIKEEQNAFWTDWNWKTDA